MKLSAFKFDLPENVIATHPAPNRDEARLMVIDRQKGTWEHRVFKDIIEYFSDGDVLVSNDTYVFPARLYGKKEKTEARIEVFLLRELNPSVHLWDVLVDPARKIRVGNKLFFGENELVAEVIDNTTSRGRTIRFLYDGDPEIFYRTLYTLGQTPIPKELGREADAQDAERFQTIFAKEDNKGAVAAPSAGLHFTSQIVKRLAIKGVDIHTITMHVGLGTFRPVEVEDLTKHKMDSEKFTVPATTVQAVNTALDAHKRVCAIGTTSLRSLESAVSAANRLKEIDSWTDKFIFPPYEFKICNALLTNFHKPRSTLVMTAAAFAGYDLLMEAYEEAVKEGYRFFSYGDAMLIL
ncbi:MAG: tRNA preQ1(34) S-adenosylmethionine ribosyltransferase-isomerase QueA [Bernardetiaceae bacterium]